MLKVLAGASATSCIEKDRRVMVAAEVDLNGNARDFPAMESAAIGVKRRLEREAYQLLEVEEDSAKEP